MEMVAGVPHVPVNRLVTRSLWPPWLDSFCTNATTAVPPDVIASCGALPLPTGLSMVAGVLHAPPAE